MIEQIEWFEKSEILPECGKRVLTYSPRYENYDETMLYRIMNAEFVKMSIDIKFWAYLYILPNKGEAG